MDSLDEVPIVHRRWSTDTSSATVAALLPGRLQEPRLDADLEVDAIPAGARSPASPLASKRSIGLCVAIAAVTACCAAAGVGAHRQFMRNASDHGQQKWRLWDWAKPERPKALGMAGNALHARGLIRLRGGLCLHAEQELGSRVRLGPCGIALGGDSLALDQQWQFEEDSGMLRHESAGCLDGGGELLHMWTCDDANPNQVWSYTKRPGWLLNVARGKCLSAASPLQNGIFVDIAKCEVSTTNAWSVGLRVGQVQLVDTGSCLNADATDVSTASCRPHPSMHWLHDPSTGHVVSLGSKGNCLTGTQAAEGDRDSQEGEVLHVVDGARSHDDVARNALLPHPLIPGFFAGGREHSGSERHLSAESSALRLTPCSGNLGLSPQSGGQEWNFDVPSGGLRLGDRCLAGSDVTGHEGSLVRLSECTMGDTLQTWAVGAMTGQLRNRRGICLHAEEASVCMSVCEAIKGQSWTYDGTSLTLRVLQGLCLERHDKFLALAVCVPTSAEQRWSYDAKQHRYRQGEWCLSVAQEKTHDAPVFAEPCGDQFMQEWDLPSVSVSTTILTCETRNEDRYMSLSGVPGRSVLNTGKGAIWEGFVTKPKAFLQALQERAVANELELIILMDSDVVDGGCSDTELIDRYNRVVAASGGARVVVSADPHQYPEIPGAKDMYMSKELQDRRRNVLEAFGIGYHTFDGLEWKDVPGYHSYSFPNSGFVMGPVDMLEKVMQCVLLEGYDEHCIDPSKPEVFKPAAWRTVMGSGKARCFDDQRALTICAMKHPELITLDYSGSLMYTSYGMDNPFVNTDTGLKNKLVGATQCFVHLNCQDCSNAWKWGNWRSDLPPLYRGSF